MASEQPLAAAHRLAVLLMGPTASGKTELAIRLREALDGELISVDSALVYRGMDIGTAMPDAGTLARAPHRLIDICDPATPYSAADFRGDACQAMDEAVAAGRTPILVGGTMLYFRALCFGMAAMPAASPETREALARRFDEEGARPCTRNWPAWTRLPPPACTPTTVSDCSGPWRSIRWPGGRFPNSGRRRKRAERAIHCRTGPFPLRCRPGAR